MVQRDLTSILCAMIFEKYSVHVSCQYPIQPTDIPTSLVGQFLAMFFRQVDAVQMFQWSSRRIFHLKYSFIWVRRIYLNGSCCATLIFSLTCHHLLKHSTWENMFLISRFVFCHPRSSSIWTSNFSTYVVLVVEKFTFLITQRCKLLQRWNRVAFRSSFSPIQWRRYLLNANSIQLMDCLFVQSGQLLQMISFWILEIFEISIWNTDVISFSWTHLFFNLHFRACPSQMAF